MWGRGPYISRPTMRQQASDGAHDMVSIICPKPLIIVDVDCAHRAVSWLTILTVCCEEMSLYVLLWSVTAVLRFYTLSSIDSTDFRNINAQWAAWGQKPPTISWITWIFWHQMVRWKSLNKQSKMSVFVSAIFSSWRTINSRSEFPWDYFSTSTLPSPKLTDLSSAPTSDSSL